MGGYIRKLCRWGSVDSHSLPSLLHVQARTSDRAFFRAIDTGETDIKEILVKLANFDWNRAFLCCLIFEWIGSFLACMELGFSHLPCSWRLSCWGRRGGVSYCYCRPRRYPDRIGKAISRENRESTQIRTFCVRNKIFIKYCDLTNQLIREAIVCHRLLSPQKVTLNWLYHTVGSI